MEKIRFNHKVTMEASSYVRNFIIGNTNKKLESFIGNKRDFEHSSVDSHNLLPKRTLDSYSYEGDNEILLYNAVCILNNKIIELETKYFKLQDKIDSK